MWKAYLKVVLFVLLLVALVVGILVALSRPAKADEVCLKDGKGEKCLEVKGDSANTAKVQALVRQAKEVLRGLNENGRAKGAAATELERANKKFGELEKKYVDLERSAKSGEQDGKTAKKQLAEAERRLTALEHEFNGQRKAHLGLAKKVKLLVSRRVNLELGVLGGAAWKYGATLAPLAVSLVFPMGESGLWKTRLTAGLGLSPSVGVGWLAVGALARSLSRGSLELGPAVLGLGDAGDLVGDTRGWVLGAGAQVRMKVGARAFVSVTPFVGVASKTNVVGVGEWVTLKPVTPPTPNCPCASGGSEGYWTGGTASKRCLGFSGGALVSIGAVLF